MPERELHLQEQLRLVGALVNALADKVNVVVALDLKDDVGLQCVTFTWGYISVTAQRVPTGGAEHMSCAVQVRRIAVVLLTQLTVPRVHAASAEPVISK